MNDSPADIELFRQARDGDLIAFEALLARYQSRVHHLAKRICGGDADAEDVTQQTFLSLVEHLRDFREESSVATWIVRIATNHALKLLRKRRGLPTSQLPEEVDRSSGLPHPDYIANWRDLPDRLAEVAEVRRLLDDALAELNEKYRVVFLLRDVEGLSVAETAAALGISPSNVKVRLLRARLQLRERLTRALGDESTRVTATHDHEAKGL